MNKRLLSALTGLALVPVVLSAHADRMVFPKTLLQLNSMVGNSDEYIADTGVAIRGILGGPFPWDLTRAVGKLDSTGALRIRVQGLIIPASAGYGYNPAPFFQAVVSCYILTTGTYQNVVTPKADTRMIGDPTLGNAVIDSKVTLRESCIAPIVFITSPAKKNPPTGYWFAATGWEPASSNQGGE